VESLPLVASNAEALTPNGVALNANNIAALLAQSSRS
jgi:hypothetical protein